MAGCRRDAYSDSNEGKGIKDILFITENQRGTENAHGKCPTFLEHFCHFVVLLVVFFFGSLVVEFCEVFFEYQNIQL